MRDTIRLPTMVEDAGGGGDPSTTRQRVRQQISVPFLWEERPGKPKTGCSRPRNHHPRPPPPPQQPIPDGGVCVPFGWEEKPGKPLVRYGVDAEPPTNPFVSNPEEEEMLVSYLRSLRLDVVVDGDRRRRRRHLPKQSSCTSREEGRMVMHYGTSTDDGEEEEGSGGQSNSSGGDTELHGGGDGEINDSVVELHFNFPFLSAGLLGNSSCFCCQAAPPPTTREPTLEELILLTPKLSCARKTKNIHNSYLSKEMEEKIDQMFTITGLKSGIRNVRLRRWIDKDTDKSYINLACMAAVPMPSTPLPKKEGSE